MTQWHPVFAQLLRPVVEAYYDVQTTMPVGDAPREADFVLLRRTSPAPPPFRGLWRHLTTWNILEFKGPTVSPRVGDLELLVELGLGIDRRLQTERARQGQRRLGPEEVSFWYLANHLGRRLLRALEQKLGPLEAVGAGLWRCRLLGRLVYWVSSIDLPVEVDSLPLHVIGHEPAATERAVAELVVEEPSLQVLYAGWLASLHAETWKEVEAMARAAGKRLKIDYEAAIEAMGLDHIIEQVGYDRLVEMLEDKEVIKRIGVDRWIANLSPAERREAKRRL